MSSILFRLLLVVLLLSGWQLAISQKIIEGSIVDLANGEPLSGATVLSLSDSSSTISDSKGQFLLSSEEATALIEVNFLGYDPIRINLKSQTGFLKIGLSANAESLGEILVKANLDSRTLQNHAGAISLVTLSNQNTGNSVSIEPILNSIPGIFMHSGALNTNRITMRGIGSRSLFSTAKIRAYFNHIPLTNGIGETALEDIDLSLLNRVEVVRGPSSSVYGAGLGGTIILNSKKQTYQKTDFSNALTLGSFNLVRNTHRLSHSSDLMNINLNFNHTHSDGYRDNNNYNRSSLGFTGQFYPGTKGTITLFANLIDLKAFIPSSIDSTTFEDNPSAAAFTWQKTKGFEDYSKYILGVSYDHQFKKGLNLATALFTNHFNSHEVRPFNILNEKSNTAGGRTSFHYNVETSTFNITVSAGSELFIESYDWTTLENIDGLGEAGIALSDNEEVRRYFNVFSQIEFEFKHGTRITAGLNLNGTNYSLTDRFLTDSIDLSGKYSFEKILSPRFSISQPFLENQNLFLAISHGFSPPSLEETLTPEGNINPEIKPEKGWNLELGAKGYFFNKKIYYDFTIFTMFIHDLLVSERVGPDIFVGVNAGKTTHAGIETDIRWKAFQSSSKGIKLVELSANYTFSHFRFTEFIDNENNYSGNKLTGVPDHVLNFAIDLKTRPGLYSRIGFRHVSSMPMRDDSSIFSDPYSLLNAKIGFHSVFSERWAIDLNAGLNNMLNEKYASMILVNAGSFGGNAPRYFYPGLPTNWYAGLEIRYYFK